MSYVRFWSWLLDLFLLDLLIWHFWIQCWYIAFNKGQGDMSDVVSKVFLDVERLMKIPVL